MTKDQLNEIIRLHQLWVKGERGGCKANLTGAYLTGANLTRANLDGAYLTGANLTRANLSGAYLTGANLDGANLTGANLDGANLTGANLTRANLSGAYLTGANLDGAYLTGANLDGANLTGANLTGANLSGAYLPDNLIINRTIVPDGQFIGYKKLNNDAIATLLIPKSAQRCGGLAGRKCRSSKVKVVKIEGGDPNKDPLDMHTQTILYKVGAWVKPDKYDPDPRQECTNGIHFFITRLEAEEY